MAAAIPEILGLSVSEGVAFALGIAIGPAVEPLAQEAKNKSWTFAVDRSDGEFSRPPEVGALAAIVAESVEALGWGRQRAKEQGINQEDFDALFHEAEEAPGFATLLQMLRRNLIGLDDFEHGLRKAKFEGRWDTALEALQHDRLAPAQIALGIVRSIIEDPGFLPVTLDTSGGKVPAYPTSNIAPLTEAQASGIDKERLRVMVGEIGRPMAPESAASATFRNIIARADYNRAILEGDIRPEWAEAIFEAARQIPSAADFVNARIRGWITDAEMYAGTARHGMSQADTHLLYLRTGRPAAPGQMATAAARGIDGPDGRPMDRDQFLKGIAQSDIRPEWGQMLWETRFLYPPLFQITRLVQAGAIDADTAKDWAIKDRYPPEVVNALHAYWLTLGGATTDTHIGKAQTHLWTTLHTSYKNGESDETAARDKMTTLGIPAGSQATILHLWNEERELIRKQLTPSQIKKAWAKAVTNPDTGQPWTRDEALAALIDRGYSTSDASTFLDE